MQDEAGHSRLLLPGRPRPGLGPCILGQLQLGVGLHAEGLRLHTGGEFKRISGVVQNSYARLSPASA
jgi:hypothetical protein